VIIQQLKELYRKQLLLKSVADLDAGGDFSAINVWKLCIWWLLLKQESILKLKKMLLAI